MFLENRNIKLHNDNRENLITYKNRTYQVDFLNDDGKYIHGGNGVIFKLTDEQENRDFVIKFLKFSEQEGGENNWKIEKRIKRFEREIEALLVAKENSLSNIVEIYFNGIEQIDGYDFQYYVMQKCDCTLNQYLSTNDLSIPQKTLLCYKILRGIQGLHEYKIYHRDIKHDNIYFIENEPYIGDLGLANYRNSDIYINEKGELIGPTGWFSPEAINKYLVEKTTNLLSHNCIIDEKSEVFQLGKLFWYIYQGNLPIGQLVNTDFIPREDSIFNILFNMLLYSKGHRWNTVNVEHELNSYLTIN